MQSDVGFGAGGVPGAHFDVGDAGGRECVRDAVSQSVRAAHTRGADVDRGDQPACNHRTAHRFRLNPGHRRGRTHIGFV